MEAGFQHDELRDPAGAVLAHYGGNHAEDDGHDRTEEKHMPDFRRETDSRKCGPAQRAACERFNNDALRS